MCDGFLMQPYPSTHFHVSWPGVGTYSPVCYFLMTYPAFCAGVVQAGVQFILFAGLLYVLLSADSDPVLYVVRVLPLSCSSQKQAAAAFSNSMRGVFLCALKVRFDNIFRCPLLRGIFPFHLGRRLVFALTPAVFPLKHV